MSPEVACTICFALAIVHTFLVKRFQHIATKYTEGSVGENLFHLLGETEVVFGVWAGIYLLFLTFSESSSVAIDYLESRNFTEPIFVFVIMVVCASRPIIIFATKLIDSLARPLPLKPGMSFFVTALVIGPLLGSLITEPAAMTVTALILRDRLFAKNISTKLMYATMGLLFVNVSIGGTLTPYAAPPVLMVAKKWNWNVSFMMTHFGWKSLLACLVSTTAIAGYFRSELSSLDTNETKSQEHLPFGIILSHLIVLALIVVTAHHVAVFFSVFLFFLGLVSVTSEFQHELKLREGLLVAFFLGGLVTLGEPQRWWLEPILVQLSSLSLYFGSMGLTAMTDNAALTYLGSQVPSLSTASQYALVAGSVVGGGLTVIANAPNPAGYGILNRSFGPEGISPLKLFISALFPTAVAALCFAWGIH